MPKLIENPTKMKQKLLSSFIAKNMCLYDLNDEQLAIKLHISKRTLQRRKKEPNEFTLGEFWKLCEVLKFTEDEKKQFI